MNKAGEKKNHVLNKSAKPRVNNKPRAIDVENVLSMRTLSIEMKEV